MGFRPWRDYLSLTWGSSHHDAGGVLLRPFDAWPYLEPPKIARIQATEAIVRSIIEVARSQIGKPFEAIVHYGAFLDDQAHEQKRNWRDSGQWVLF